MAGVRMTGLASGLDTESLVKQLSDAYQMKVDNAQKKQTKAEWKKEAWASLNTKLMNFYKGALNTFKSVGTYNSKSVNGSLSGLNITANAKSANGNHKVQVMSTASAQMWTGHRINKDTITATSYKGATDSSAKIADLYDSNGYSVLNKINGSSFLVGHGDQSTEVTIQIDENTTVDEMLTSVNGQMSGTGLRATFEQGALKFENISAVASMDADGKTTYADGYAVTINAKDQASADALGMHYDQDGKGTTVAPLSNDNDKNSVNTSTVLYEKVQTADATVTGTTKLVDLGIAEGTVIKVNGKELSIDRTSTLNSLATAMAGTGINANYDASQGRFYLSSTATGTDNAFEVEADADTLAKLGLDLQDGEAGKIAATNAEVVYNGVTYEQASNTFNINGLTIEAIQPGEAQNFTVSSDVDGIYDKVKSFIKEYNSLITEMNTLYNAESSRGYEPLTSDEKEAMNDEDIKNWESKIKNSLLRRDSTISSLLTNMRTILNKSVEVTGTDGSTKRYALSSFGIVTGEYSEKGQLHINGDADDASYSSKEDELKAAIAENPDALVKTLTGLGTEIYEYMQKAMKKTDTSSALTFYDDVTMDKDIKNYKQDVKDLKEKVTAEEDKYYKQFSAMETAMAKLQSQQTYISQLFGSSS